MLPLSLRAMAAPYSSSSFIATFTYASIVNVIFLLGVLSEKYAYGTTREVDLEEEVVVIVGGKGGLGGCIAEVYGMKGVRTVVLDVAVSKDEEEKDEEAGGVRYYRCDVGDRQQVEEVWAHVRANVGTPTVLINCAAVVRAKRFVDLSMDEVERYVLPRLSSLLPILPLSSHFPFSFGLLCSSQLSSCLSPRPSLRFSSSFYAWSSSFRPISGARPPRESIADPPHSIFRTNLLSHYHLTSLFLPPLLTRPSGGHLITTSSVLGSLGASHLSLYTSSKAALSTFHASLTAELRSSAYPPNNIRTILVAPGQLDTPLFAGIRQNWWRRFMGPRVEVREVAMRIVGMVDRGEGGEVRMPAYARWIGGMGALPVGAQRALRELSGVDEEGRGVAEKAGGVGDGIEEKERRSDHGRRRVVGVSTIYDRYRKMSYR